MFLPESEPNSSVAHPEAYSTLYHYLQSGKCEYAFILNNYAEHSPLCEDNGRSPTQKFFALYSTRRFPTIL